MGSTSRDSERRRRQADGQLTDDLIAFLRARLDEDERLARAAADEVEVVGGSWDGAAHIMLARASYDDTADHFARHDPARVLAEVDAKRQIVDTRSAIRERLSYWQSQEHETFEAMARADLHRLDDVLSILATAYADHPDYREEWRP